MLHVDLEEAYAASRMMDEGEDEDSEEENDNPSHVAGEDSTTPQDMSMSFSSVSEESCDDYFGWAHVFSSSSWESSESDMEEYQGDE
jgi:hypothetical protein